MYIAAVQKDVLRAYAQHQPVRNNLSVEERAALNSLQADTSIIIQPVDKGGTIVILERCEYLEEGMRQLSDRKFYELPNDPTKFYESEIHNTLKSLFTAGNITAAMMKIMSPKHPVPGRFYLLLATTRSDPLYPVTG